MHEILPVNNVVPEPFELAVAHPRVVVQTERLNKKWILDGLRICNKYIWNINIYIFSSFVYHNNNYHDGKSFVIKPIIISIITLILRVPKNLFFGMSSGKKYFNTNNFYGRLGARNYVNFNDNF